MGGIVGGCIGVTLGGVIGHTLGGHMGRKSMLLLHSGCITPLTHRQTHAAFTLVALTDAPTSAAHNNNFRMVSSAKNPGSGPRKRRLRAYAPPDQPCVPAGPVCGQ